MAPPGPVIDETTFEKILRQLRDCPFVSGRTEALNTLVKYSLTAQHIGTVMDTLPFSVERIRAAQLLAPLLTDQRQIRRVASHLRFEYERYVTCQMSSWLS